MPPFPLAAFPRQPRLEVRQNGASAVNIVLSITRDYTTYTTTIGLTPSTAPASDPTTAPVHQAPTPQATSPNPPNTGVVVGAILGSILGAMVLVVLIYKCCFENRSALYTGGSNYYNSGSESGSSSRSGRIHTRGGDLPHHHRHHHNGSVRNPRRARTRRHHGTSDRSGSRSDAASWNTRDKRRGMNGGMVMRNGVLGWRLAPRTKNHDRFERSWPRDRRDEKFTPDD